MSDFVPLRYGILGAANIARQFTRGMAGSAFGTVVAVASRGAEKAAAFAQELGIPRSLASYEALLADPEVEAIYIPLPNDMHAEWAIKAMAAGKHVLCEKPLCLTGAEARAIYDAGRKYGVRMCEAYPYMSQPQTLRLRELLADGTLGRVQLINSSFGFSIATPDGVPTGDPKNIRLDPARGGGALLDAGTYAMSFARIAAGERPTRAFAVQRTTVTGVDQTIAATLEFPSGAVAQINCSLSISGVREAMVIGEKAVVQTSYSNHAPAGFLPLRVKRGVAGNIPFDMEHLPGGDGFRAEGESFARLVRTGAGWNGCSEAESVDTVLALEAIAKSAKSGGWVDIERG